MLLIIENKVFYQVKCKSCRIICIIKKNKNWGLFFNVPLSHTSDCFYLGPYTSNISNTSNGHASYPPAYAPPTYEMSCVDSNGKTPYPTNDMMGYSNPPYPTANAPYPPTANAPYPTKDDTGGQHPWKI